MYVPTELSITGPQLVKLFKGYPVQLTSDALKNYNSRALLHPLMSKKVEAARKKGKGCRLMCSPEEILHTGCMGLKGSGRMSGCGWWSDAFNYLKEKVPQAFNWVKDTAVPAAIEAAKWTKKNIIDTPLYQEKIRPKVEGKILDTLSGLPYADITTQGAQTLFDETGLGMKKPRAINTNAVERPTATAKQSKKVTKKPVGGSFRPTGY